MVKGDENKNIFIDSDTGFNPDAFPGGAQVLVPPHPFSKGRGERMALSLQQFSMFRSWTNVNPSNNTFYIQITKGDSSRPHTYYLPCKIKPMTYVSYETLQDAIMSAIIFTLFQKENGNPIDDSDNIFKQLLPEEAGTFASGNGSVGATSGNNSIANSTRQLDISINLGSSIPTGIHKMDTSNISLVCFHNKRVSDITEFVLNNDLPAVNVQPLQGVSSIGYFNDSYCLMGGKAIYNDTVDAYMDYDSFMSTANTSKKLTIQSFNLMYLSTLDALYVRIPSIETGNWNSPSLTPNPTNDQQRLVESTIFARIPLSDAFVTEIHEAVSWQDNGNDQWQSYLKRANFETMQISITDGKGRPISQLLSSGFHTHFKMALRWDLWHAKPEKEEEKPKPSKDPSTTLNLEFPRRPPAAKGY